MLDALKRRLRDLRSVPAEVASNAAPLIEARLKRDARTRAGTAPQGISATPRAEAITIQAPDWVHRKAREKGQIEVWKEIVRETFRRVV